MATKSGKIPPRAPDEGLPVRSVKLTIAYDGTRFKGWQKGNGRTVQDVLELAILAALPSASGGTVADGTYGAMQLHFVGAGRTDAGVHAENQIASAVIPLGTDLERLLRAANERLPSDAAILDIVSAPERFHARYHAKRRTYRYSIILGAIGNPFKANYSWHIPKELDLVAMRKAVSLLEGTHDFTSLTADKSKSNRIRTIYEIRVDRQEQNLELFFTADSFLWNQVRIMTMLLVQAGLCELRENDIVALLEAKNRSLAPEPAPAKGLSLYSVEYE